MLEGLRALLNSADLAPHGMCLLWRPELIWLFAFFILACGTTHFLNIWTLWNPDYGTEGLVKGLTALASIMTAIALWPLLPRALALPSPVQLARLNAELQTEV